jgi:hypothetical protein
MSLFCNSNPKVVPFRQNCIIAVNETFIMKKYLLFILGAAFIGNASIAQTATASNGESKLSAFNASDDPITLDHFVAKIEGEGYQLITSDLVRTDLMVMSYEVTVIDGSTVITKTVKGSQLSELMKEVDSGQRLYVESINLKGENGLVVKGVNMKFVKV